MEAPAQRAFATFIPNAPPPESRRLRRTWKNLLLCAILVPSKGAADDTLEVRTLRSPAEPRGCSARIGYNLTYRTGRTEPALTFCAPTGLRIGVYGGSP